MPLTRRQRLRRYPAPPPTPEGMVWRSKMGVTVLVPALVAQVNSYRTMREYDRLPRETRDEAKGPFT